MRPKRTDDKYWIGTRNFNHIQYESDLEDYIIDLENETKQLRKHAVSGRSEQFSCPLPDARCDRHKIDDEEGRWEFCNTCKREWAR